MLAHAGDHNLTSFTAFTDEAVYFSGHTKQNLGLLTIQAATAQLTISIEVGVIRTLQLEAISLAERLFPSRFTWDSAGQDKKGSLNGQSAELTQNKRQIF